MLKNGDFFQNKKEYYLIPVISIFAFTMALFFRKSLYGIFGVHNYLTIHLIIEIFIITVSLTIAIQTWTAFPHILTSYRLGIGSLFFSICLLEVAHTITYKGMPFFFSESSVYKSTWFFIISRLTEVIGIFAIVTTKNRVITSNKRWLAYSVAFVYSSFWMILIFSHVPLFPKLVQEGIGTTTLKNNLEYGGMIIEFFVICLVFIRFRMNGVLKSMLIVASVYMMIADYFFTHYKSVYDINIFVGHWFQLAGFYFLQRGVYREAVEEPFERQKVAEAQLLQKEKFLYSITSQMGEGLLVLDRDRRVTYMNFEAERFLQWKQEELLGKNIDDFLYLSKFAFKDVSVATTSTGVKEDRLFCKSGMSFPISYVITPSFENEELAGYIIVFRDISQQIKDQETIHYMAFHDELTKLPNLRFLKEKWTEIMSQRQQEKAAILIMDIDRFTNINEALGHAFGDLILQAVAARVQEKLSTGVVLGRLPGDDFGLILPAVNDKEEVMKLIKKIHSSLKMPLQVQHLRLKVNLSIGVAVYPDFGMEFEEILHHANIALVEAQQQNHSFVFYQSCLDGKALDRLVLENDLFHALSRNELHIFYQPQVNISTGKVIGLEALLRWHHPSKGIITPEKFIPIAEETGLIIPIGEWVIRTACWQLKQLHDKGFPSLVVAVNLSIRQFYQQNLVETIKEILEETKVSPQYLELEITESMMMNFEHAMKALSELKQLGISIAIDDFGTGYSSLSYLKNLPVDRLKIDQSFVRDLYQDKDSLSVISMIISLAHHLKLEVIAEGVETSFQKEILQSERCQQVQGYLYSPPLPAEELVIKLDNIQHSFEALTS